MLKIGDFSKLTQISIRMLRYYEEKAILIPKEKDQYTKYRKYSIDQIEDANKIKKLVEFGFSLKDIKKVLLNDNQLFILLDKYKNQLEKQIHENNYKLKFIDKIKCTNLLNIEFEIKIKSVMNTKVTSVREKLKSYYDEQKLWDKLYEKIKIEKIKTRQQKITIFYCNNDEIDIEVMLEVDDKETRFKVLKGHEKCASILVYGSYNNISSAFKELAKWIEKENYEIDGDIREIPIFGPWNKNNENDYLTEIQIPIKTIDSNMM